MSTEKIIIEKGWYWSAGRKWGWDKDGVGPAGVGISKYLLQNNKTLTVEVEGKDYELDCEKARNFINKYKSAETRFGTTIGIIARDLLVKI